MNPQSGNYNATSTQHVANQRGGGAGRGQGGRGRGRGMF